MIYSLSKKTTNTALCWFFKQSFAFNKKIFFLFIIVASLSSCGIYSFRPPVTTKAKTITILNFPNNAPIIQPALAQVFTEGLKDIFTKQSSIQLVVGGGDLVMEGEITNYENKPAAIQQNSAALNRLTITVKVRFTNYLEPENDFDQAFSAYVEYESSKSLESVEDELIKEIVDQLTENIFNKAVVNW
jgi:hypothetical protein